MRVVLVRHGQTDWNVEGRAQGHADIELNPEGHRQAKLLGRRLSGMNFGLVLCSDLTRCRQTLRPLADLTPLEPEFREDLRERTFGEMEGADYVNLREWLRHEGRRLGVEDYEVRPPGGESMLDVWNRLGPVVERFREVSHDTLVVSHGGALAQLLGKLVRANPETSRSFRFSNTGLTSLWRRSDGYFTLESYDDTAHLETLVEDPALA